MNRRVLLAAVQLDLRAVDAYNVTLSLADAIACRMTVATRIDGRPLQLGGVGPQWAIYEADTAVPFMPMGLHHIDLKAA